MLISWNNKEMTMRSIYAKALADKLFKQRIVRSRKGKGSYKRQPKHKGEK